MALYYFPCLIRTDRYFIGRLEPRRSAQPDFNFVVYADDRVFTPLFTLEDPTKTILNQMAPCDKQDIPLRECHVSMQKTESGFELNIKAHSQFAVDGFHDPETGISMNYSEQQKRITVGVYNYIVSQNRIPLRVNLRTNEKEVFTNSWQFTLVPSSDCHRIVIDFGSEASQVGFRNCGPQGQTMQYDLLENIVGTLNNSSKQREWKREDLLNHEEGQSMLYRSFYAVKKNITAEARKNFPFNFSHDLQDDEIRLFISKQEVAATEHAFRDAYDIIPNLKLGIEKSLSLFVGNRMEDYSIGLHKKELITAILLRMMRVMINTKPGFRKGGIIVTLLVPNIYTQNDVFELLSELRDRTNAMLASIPVLPGEVDIEYETISESDAAFMGYQQTHPEEAALSNGEIALVIDCGKGTTDISMLLADENENYSSFFRTGFAGAGNVLLYGFVEDYLTLLMKAIPGHNDISVRDFIKTNILQQDLTADVLQFIRLMEEQKKKFDSLQPVGLTEFSNISENSISTERNISNLHRDPATLLQYSENILSGRNIRWDEEITGLIEKATDCIAQSMIASIQDVITKDIRKRIKLVMLSGRAFYFSRLQNKLKKSLRELLGEEIQISTMPAGRNLNNKNIALYGAFSGAYKITDFTGLPIDKKEGLSKNIDVFNNNNYFYRGIKIEPGNDIIYNSSLVRRNHHALKAFKNKTVDIFFTRDNIYLRLMENQKVKDVRSLYSVLSAAATAWSPVQDMKEISLFPGSRGELASVSALHHDIMKTQRCKPVKKKVPAFLQFFHF